MVPQIVVPQNGWFISGKTPMNKWMIWGVFQPIIFGSTHVSKKRFSFWTQFIQDTETNVVISVRLARASFFMSMPQKLQPHREIMLRCLPPSAQWLLKWFPYKVGSVAYNPPIGSIYHLYIAFWEVICYLPPFRGTRNNH